MRILVAEDDPGLRDVIVLGLADSGYHVDAVDRGDDAIDQLKFYEYDVAILDWRMPGAEGIEVVEWARRNRRPTAILMLTARDTPADRIRGLDSGADDYLVKPFDFGELLARVRALQRRPRGVDGSTIERGRLVLDPVTRVVTADGRVIKGKAVQFLRDRWQIDPETTVVCGDSGNDISLFKYGRERGIIVGNARSELRLWHELHPVNYHYLAAADYAAGMLEGLKYFQFVGLSTDYL